MNRWVYELIYHVPFVPIEWIYGDHRELIDELIEGKDVAPGKALDLGCGVGVESIHLAMKGFEVTGVDFSHAAIKRARRAAEVAGAPVTFVEDDLIAFGAIDRPFDLLVNFGAMSGLDEGSRDVYVENVVRLTRSRTTYTLLSLDRALGEVAVRQRLGDALQVETVLKKPGRLLTPAMTTYWLTRR